MTDPAARSDPHDPATAAPRAGAAVRLALVLTAVAGVFLGLRELVSPDLGFHLATADWIVANGWVPATDPFTYTVGERAYVDLQWLFQLLVRGVYAALGSFGIVLSAIAATLAFAALLVVRTQRRNGRITMSTVVLLLVFFFGTSWEPRPHLLSWLWGAIVLLVLEEYVRGNKRGLPLLPVVMLLWVNSHSLFVLGLVILGAYVGSGVLRRTRLDRSLLIWGGAGVLACLCNPYFVDGLLFPLVQLRDIQGAADFKSPLTGIGEFTSPFAFDGYVVDGRVVPFQPRLFWQLFAVLALVGVIAARARVRLVEALLFAAFFYVFWRANKNLGYFVMVCFPVVADGLDTAVENWRNARAKPSVWAARMRAAGVVAGAVAMVLSVSGHVFALGWTPDRRGTAFHPEVLPVGACAFINEHKIRGRVMNTWNDGGYIAWSTGQKVFIYSHGEVMGPEFYDAYVELKEPDRLGRALTSWRPTIAVVPFKTAPAWLYELGRNRDWRLVYRDDHSALFLHKNTSRSVPALAAPKPDVDYPVFGDAKITEVVEAATTAPGRGVVGALLGSRGYPQRELARAGFWLQSGHVDACIGLSIDALANVDFAVPDLLLTLGYALDAKRAYALADRCFDAFLAADDDPQFAREIAGVRRRRRG